MLPNGDGLGAAALDPNAPPDPNALVPEEAPNGELDAAAGDDPKALLPELDPNGELEAGAGAAPKGLGAGAAVPGVGAEPKGLGAGAAVVPKPVGGFDSVAPVEPNEGFVPPTEGREEATPLPNPNDAAGAGAAGAGAGKEGFVG